MSSATHAEIRAERESIANELLNVLSHIRPVHMEPNSVSFCMKVRSVAGTLLPDVVGNGEDAGGMGRATATSALGGGDEGTLAASYLRSFFDVLMDLEKSGGPGGGGGRDVERILAEGGLGEERDPDEEDEEELGRWTGLREQQREFTARGQSMYR